jgi:hypothetical protein
MAPQGPVVFEKAVIFLFFRDFNDGLLLRSYGVWAW